MLDRIRGMVQRLELPQEDDVVYRIMDDAGNAVEVTPAQYARWRVQHDVARLAVVGQDTVGNVQVKTTFSVMPENRSYKPFGTSAYAMPDYDPLMEYSNRYDTRREAEQGHRHTEERVRRDLAKSLLFDEKVDVLAGIAGEVRLAIAVDLPAMFGVNAHSDVNADSSDEVKVTTPMLRADGTRVELTVSHSETGFVVTAAGDSFPGVGASAPGEPGVERVDQLCRTLGLSVESGTLFCRASDASQLGEAMVRLAQGIACVSMLDRQQA